MSEGIENIGSNKKNRTFKKNDDENNEKYINQLASRYQLHIKQQEIKTNLKINNFLPLKILANFQKCLSSWWNKFCTQVFIKVSVNIRGSITEKEIFTQYCQPYLQEVNQSEQQNLIKFQKMLSNKPRIQDDFVLDKRVICILYTKSCVVNFMNSLQTQFLRQITSMETQLPWVLSVKVIDQNDKSCVWVQKVKQFANQQALCESQYSNTLTQITKMSLNADHNRLKTKESGRITHSSQWTYQQKSVVIKNISYPLVIPLWRGLFDEIIMFKPKLLQTSTLHEINEIFWQREELEKQVISKVQANTKIKLIREQVDMESIHKIELSNEKQHI